MAVMPDGMLWVGCLAFLAFVCAWCPAAQGQVRQDDLVPFVLPWDDAAPGPTNLSGWNHKPAGKFGPVRAGEDGHLYVGAERIRFFGVDLTRRTATSWDSSTSRRWNCRRSSPESC